MKKKIIFLGTSFLGAIKLGWDSLNVADFDATFVGFSGPVLIGHMASGVSVVNRSLVVDPSCFCFVSGVGFDDAKHSGNVTFPTSCKQDGLILDLAAFDRVVFVDMFYRLHPKVIIDGAGVYVEGTPVSRPMLSDFRIHGFLGWCTLSNHPTYGNVLFQRSLPLLLKVVDAVQGNRSFLVSAPRPPQGEVDAVAVYGSTDKARSSLSFIEYVYTSTLNAVGISYVSQPPDVFDAEGCFTDKRFSRGLIPAKPGIPDAHMNKAYGEIISCCILNLLRNDEQADSDVC